MCSWIERFIDRMTILHKAIYKLSMISINSPFCRNRKANPKIPMELQDMLIIKTTWKRRNNVGGPPLSDFFKLCHKAIVIKSV